MVCDQCISLYLSADIVEKGNERHGVLPPSHRSVHPEDVKEQNPGLNAGERNSTSSLHLQGEIRQILSVLTYNTSQ